MKSYSYTKSEINFESARKTYCNFCKYYKFDKASETDNGSTVGWCAVKHFPVYMDTAIQPRCTSYRWTLHQVFDADSNYMKEWRFARDSRNIVKLYMIYDNKQTNY